MRTPSDPMPSTLPASKLARCLLLLVSKSLPAMTVTRTVEALMLWMRDASYVLPRLFQGQVPMQVNVVGDGGKGKGKDKSKSKKSDRGQGKDRAHNWNSGQQEGQFQCYCSYCEKCGGNEDVISVLTFVCLGVAQVFHVLLVGLRLLLVVEVEDGEKEDGQEGSEEVKGGSQVEEKTTTWMAMMME